MRQNRHHQMLATDLLEVGQEDIFIFIRQRAVSLQSKHGKFLYEPQNIFFLRLVLDCIDFKCCGL